MAPTVRFPAELVDEPLELILVPHSLTERLPDLNDHERRKGEPQLRFPVENLSLAYRCTQPVSGVGNRGSRSVPAAP